MLLTKINNYISKIRIWQHPVARPRSPHQSVAMDYAEPEVGTLGLTGDFSSVIFSHRSLTTHRLPASATSCGRFYESEEERCFQAACCNTWGGVGGRAVQDRDAFSLHQARKGEVELACELMLR